MNMHSRKPQNLPILINRFVSFSRSSLFIYFHSRSANAQETLGRFHIYHASNTPQREEIQKNDSQRAIITCNVHYVDVLTFFGHCSHAFFTPAPCTKSARIRFVVMNEPSVMRRDLTSVTNFTLNNFNIDPWQPFMPLSIQVDKMPAILT